MPRPDPDELTSDCHRQRRNAGALVPILDAVGVVGAGEGGGGNNNRTTDFQSPSRAERVHNSRLQITEFLGGDRLRVHFPGAGPVSHFRYHPSSCIVFLRVSGTQDDIDGEGGGPLSATGVVVIGMRGGQDGG